MNEDEDETEIFTSHPEQPLARRTSDKFPECQDGNAVTWDLIFNKLACIYRSVLGTRACVVGSFSRPDGRNALVLEVGGESE